MLLGDAKQLVSGHIAWRNMVQANEALYEETEAAFQTEGERT
jgi:hypothetical protein